MQRVVITLILFACVFAHEDVENLIIGSGFGGSVTAHRLTEAGQEVVILERGNWYDTSKSDNAFSTFREPDMRSAWFQNTAVAPGYTASTIDVGPGVFEYLTPEPNELDPGITRSGTGLVFWCGSAVGGGSVVYNGVLLKPIKKNFEAAFGNDDLYKDLYDEMEEFYSVARRVLKPEQIPDSILETEEWTNARIFRDQAVNGGFPEKEFTDTITYGVAKIPYGITWDLVQAELDGDKPASLIQGDLWYGVNSGAKYSTGNTGNYLDRALKTQLADVRALHDVTGITFDSATERYIVTALHLSATGDVIEEVEFRAKHVFVCAGSLGTSALMTRAKGRGDLPKLNSHVGTKFGGNGDSFAIRSANSDGSNTFADEGAPGAFGLFAYNATGSPIVLFDMPVVWAPLLGINNLIVQIGMGIPTDPGAGSWSYDPETDHVSYDWPLGDADTNVWEALTETVSAINSGNPGSSGGTDSISDMMGGSMHPLGGMPLGRATDMYGRVKNYKGLYVLDASLIPGSTGAVNPSLTTVALVERCLDTIVAEDFPQRASSASKSSSESSSASTLSVSLSLIFVWITFCLF